MDVQLNSIFHHGFTLQSACLCFTQQHLSVNSQMPVKEQNEQEVDAEGGAVNIIFLLSVHYLHAIQRIFVFTCMIHVVGVVVVAFVFVFVFVNLVNIVIAIAIAIAIAEAIIFAIVVACFAICNEYA